MTLDSKRLGHYREAHKFSNERGLAVEVIQKDVQAGRGSGSFSSGFGGGIGFYSSF